MAALFLVALCVAPSVSIVNFYRGDGDFLDNCREDPNYVISELLPSDEAKVKDLEFVQALFRHGTRILSNTPPRLYFPVYAQDNLPPNGDWVIQCNITSIYSSEFIETSRNSLLQLRNVYPQNQQWYDFSNCEHTQSLYATLPQMESLANTIKEAYIRGYIKNTKKKKYLFEENDIITTKASTISKNIRLYSTGYNRVYDSVYWFTQFLLELEETKGKKGKKRKKRQKEAVVLDLIIHDTESEPFRAENNAECLASDQWNQWLANYGSATNNSAIQEEYRTTGFGAQVIADFITESQGGAWLGPVGAPWWILGFHYCAGLDIPISKSLFNDMIKWQIEYNAAYDTSPNGNQANVCFNKITMLPAYQYLKDVLNEVKQGKGPKIYVVGSHGFTIRDYLWGLNIYNDFTIPPMAELTTLEVYSAREGNYNGIDFYFRWTRTGDFLPFPGCDYDNGNTELCDLQILLDAIDDAVPIEDYTSQVCSVAIDECFCGFC